MSERRSNEHGVPVLHRICGSCGAAFTVCPAPEDESAWTDCLVPECPSYDPQRDCDPAQLLEPLNTN